MAKKKVTKKTKAKKSVKKPTKKTTKKTTKKAPRASAKKATLKKASVTKTQKKTVAQTSEENAMTEALLGRQMTVFTCHDSQGNTFDLANQKGRKTVLYFYPKDDTPGCTIEGKEFSDLHSAFQQKKTDVYGVSRDSVKSHDKFKCKYGFQFELLSDEDEKICRLFDVIKEKNMYGKMVMGIERSTFILDEDLKVIYAERKVKAEGHAQRILDQIK